jgi:hypothetical protein
MVSAYYIYFYDPVSWDLNRRHTLCTVIEGGLHGFSLVPCQRDDGFLHMGRNMLQ